MPAMAQLMPVVARVELAVAQVEPAVTLHVQLSEYEVYHVLPSLIIRNKSS